MKNKVVLTLTLLPIVVLGVIAFIETPLRMSSSSPRDIADILSWFRIGSGILVILMILYFIQFMFRSNDSELMQKRTLWVFVLLFGNIFALPVFWFLHYRRLNREKHSESA